MRRRRSEGGFLIIACFMSILSFHIPVPAMAETGNIKCECSFPTLNKAQLNGKDKPDRVDKNGTVFSYYCFATYAGRCSCDNGKCLKHEYLAPCECGKPLERESVTRCDTLRKEACAEKGDCLPWWQKVKLECKEYEIKKIDKQEIHCDLANVCSSGKCQMRIEGTVNGKNVGEFDTDTINGRCGGDETMEEGEETSDATFMEQYLQRYSYEVNAEEEQVSPAASERTLVPSDNANELQLIPTQGDQAVE